MGQHHWQDPPATPPLMYRRDVPGDDANAITAETEHIRDHLAAVADADDDPATHRGSVQIHVVDHVDGDPQLVSIIGFLRAVPDAPYLRADFDPAADHPEIAFQPFGEHDADAFAAWQAGP